MAGYEFYGFGVVTEDKPKDTDTISVWIYTVLPEVTGVVKDIKVKNTVKTKDLGNVDSSNTAEGTQVADALWLNVNDFNRFTSPSINKKETVIILRKANDERLRWVSMGREGKFRTREHVVHMFSSKDDPNTPMTPLNSVVLDVDTYVKTVQLTTPEGDGNPITALLDYGAGMFSMLSNDKGVVVDFANGEVIIKSKLRVEGEATFDAFAIFKRGLKTLKGIVGCKC